MREPGRKAWAFFISEKEQRMTEKQMFDFLVAGGLSEHGAAVLL